MNERKKKVLALSNLLSVSRLFQVPSYDNLGGTGNRTSIITSSTSLTIGGGLIANLVNGSFVHDNSNSLYWNDGQAVAGKFIKWRFSTKVLITEIKYYQGAIQSQGVWKAQGSDDDSNWIDIGASFTLGDLATDILDLSANAIGYTYYRLLGVSGQTSFLQWNEEVEFKIGNPL